MKYASVVALQISYNGILERERRGGDVSWLPDWLQSLQVSFRDKLRDERMSKAREAWVRVLSGDMLLYRAFVDKHRLQPVNK